MTSRAWVAAPAAVLGLALIAGCGSSPPAPSIVAACGQPVIRNLSAFDTEIDTANLSNPGGSAADAHHLTLSVRHRLTGAAKQLGALAEQLAATAPTPSKGALSLAEDMRAVAADFRAAVDGPGGYTSDQLARATDTDTGNVLGACPK
jgi:hypothetical protein